MGGAVAIEQMAGNTTISGNTFNGNILVSSATGTLTGNVTEGNTPNADVSVSALGGAVLAMAEGGNVTVTSNTFTNNTAKATAIALTSGETYIDPETGDERFPVVSGTANATGGALHVAGDAVTLTNNTFEGNSAIAKATVTGENSSATAEASGGAVYVAGYGSIISSNTFNSNSISGIYMGENLNQETISNLLETAAGGAALFVTGEENIIEGNTFAGNFFIPATGENMEFGFGGAMAVFGTSNTISNNTFIGNRTSENVNNEAAAYKAGGALYAKGDGTTIEGNTFTSNKGGMGGALYVDGEN